MFSKLFGKKSKEKDVSEEKDLTLDEADKAIFSSDYKAFAHDEQQKLIDKAAKTASIYINTQSK